MVLKAEIQMFDLPNDGQSLSTDIARPYDLLDDEEPLVSADAHRSLYLIAHIPQMPGRCGNVGRRRAGRLPCRP